MQRGIPAMAQSGGNAEYENLHFKKSTVWRAFSKTSVFLAENAVYVWAEVQTEKKKFCFRKYLDTCGRGLRKHTELPVLSNSAA